MSEDLRKEFEEFKREVEDRLREIGKILSAGNLDELLTQKEEILSKVDEIRSRFEGGEISREEYESRLEECVSQLSKVDEKLSGLSEFELLLAKVREYTETVEDLERTIKGTLGESGIQSIVRDVGELKEKIESYRNELSENVKRLLQVDAKTIEEVRELRRALTDVDRVKEVQSEIERVRKMYEELITEEKLKQLLESVEKKLADQEKRFEEERGKSREEIGNEIKKLRGDFENLSREVQNISELRSRIDDLQKAIAGIGKTFGDFADVHKMKVDELASEREKILSEIDALRGSREMGKISGEEYESRVSELKRRLDLVDQRISELRKADEIREDVMKKLSELVSLLASKEEVKDLASKLRESMRNEELKEIRDSLELIRASLRNRMEEIPLEIEERIRSALAGAKTSPARDELGRKFENMLRSELQRVEGLIRQKVAEIENLRESLRKGEEERARMEEGIRELMRKIDALSSERVLLGRELEKLRRKVEEEASPYRGKSTDDLLRMKEEIVEGIRRLGSRVEDGLISREEYEQKVREKIEEMKKIDAALEEGSRIDYLIMKMEEQEKLIGEVISKLKSMDEMRSKSLEKLTDYLEKRLAMVENEIESKLKSTTEPKIKSSDESFLQELRKEMENLRSSLSTKEVGQEIERLVQEVKKLREETEKEKEVRKELERRTDRLSVEVSTALKELTSQLKNLISLRGELEEIERFLSLKRKSLPELLEERDKILALLQRKGG